jgi:hypothetical protein
LVLLEELEQVLQQLVEERMWEERMREERWRRESEEEKEFVQEAQIWVPWTLEASSWVEEVLQQEERTWVVE